MVYDWPVICRFSIFLLLVVFLVSCGALSRLDNIEFSQTAALEVLGIDAGNTSIDGPLLPSLNNLNASFEQNLSSKDIELDKVDHVKLKAFELSATSPQGADLSFLSKVDIFLEAPGLPKVLIAHSNSFPQGIFTLPLKVEDVNLKSYMSDDSISVSVDIQGDVPQNTTTISGLLTFDIDVNLKALIP